MRRRGENASKHCCLSSISTARVHCARVLNDSSTPVRRWQPWPRSPTDRSSASPARLLVSLRSGLRARIGPVPPRSACRLLAGFCSVHLQWHCQPFIGRRCVGVIHVGIQRLKETELKAVAEKCSTCRLAGWHGRGLLGWASTVSLSAASRCSGSAVAIVQL